MENVTDFTDRRVSVREEVATPNWSALAQAEDTKALVCMLEKVRGFRED